ncbi:hypothetical protein DCC26_01065 [Auritidibacter sp. NML120779]|nr:hypothetical protein DCC26_01065 [Auritidibacter sp. NML120779]
MPTRQNDERTIQRSSFARVPAAFRLQFMTPSNFIWVPVMVFVATWALFIGISVWVQLVANDRVPAEDPFYTAVSQATVWCLAIMAGYAGSHTFPFSMALSYSRRVFVLGAGLAFATVSAAYGVAFTLAALVERATNGYGIESYTFDLPVLTDGPGGLASTGLVTALVCLVAMLFGFGMVIVFKRFGLIGMWLVLIALVLVVLLIAMLITTYEAWPQVGRWLSEQNTLSFSGYLAVATIVLGVLDYLMIRKATP